MLEEMFEALGTCRVELPYPVVESALPEVKASKSMTRRMILIKAAITDEMS